MMINHKHRPDDVHSVVFAEFPDPTTCSVVRMICLSYEIHVLQTEVLAPKIMQMQPVTTFEEQCDISYRPRRTQTTTNRHRQITNEWVVPYNGFLLLEHDAHCNVEILQRAAIKYLYKYL